MNFIDTHTHLDGEEFDADRDETIARAKAAGVSKVFIPAIDMPSVSRVLAVCDSYSGYAYPMIGLHPEEVKADWQDVLKEMKPVLDANRDKVIAIGEVGLDYYWSREFEQEQLDAFEEQVKWSVEYRLPLMIHCRKGQNEWCACCAVMRKTCREECSTASPATRKKPPNCCRSINLSSVLAECLLSRSRICPKSCLLFRSTGWCLKPTRRIWLLFLCAESVTRAPMWLMY